MRAPETPWRRGTRVVTLAFALGALSGVLQVMVGAARHVLGGDFIWLSYDYVWMTPLGTLVLFLVAAAPVVLLATVIPSVGDVRVSAFIFGTLGVLTLVLLIPALHHLALLAAALGAGARVAGWVGADPSRRTMLLARVATGSLLAAGLASGWREVALRRGEARTVASLDAAAPGAPNVLVIILDTVRAASMSFLGYPRNTTPNLAALGAEGAVFEQAHSTAPWTLPSHAGMFTARYPSQLSTDWRKPLDGAQPTLAEELARRGYRTAGFAANHFYTSRESGLARGFEHWEDYRRTPRQVLLSNTLLQTNLFREFLHGAGVMGRLKALITMDLRLQQMWTSHRKFAPLATQEFLRWQAQVRGRPFFAFINLYDAHLPYDPPSGFATRFSMEPAPLDLYDGSIAYMDEALGAMFGELRRRGVLDNTLVIVSSDHGEAFGEHGLHGHGNSLYRMETHVPLVVRFPARVPASTRVAEPVTLRDVAATVLDAAGAAPGTHRLPGASWLPLLTRHAPAAGSGVVTEVSAGINTAPSDPVSRGAMRSIITDSTHYIRNGDGAEELFSWRRDPAESQDLVTSAEAAPLLPVLRAALARALR